MLSTICCSSAACVTAIFWHFSKYPLSCCSGRQYKVWLLLACLWQCLCHIVVSVSVVLWLFCCSLPFLEIFPCRSQQSHLRNWQLLPTCSIYCACCCLPHGLMCAATHFAVLCCMRVHLSKFATTTDISASKARLL